MFTNPPPPTLFDLKKCIPTSSRSLIPNLLLFAWQSSSFGDININHLLENALGRPERRGHVHLDQNCFDDSFEDNEGYESYDGIKGFEG